jgi:hypothetical protein
MEVVMGLTGFLKRKAHKEYLDRAMEHSWTAINGIGMVFGPLSLLLQSTQPTRDEVETHINRWLNAWSDVREQNHRNLIDSGDEYGIWAGTNLADILLKFDWELESIQNNQELDGNEMIAEVVGLNSNTAHGFFEFHTLLEGKGREIGFDATKYEQKAVRKAHKFWKPTVTGLGGLF